MLFKEPLEATFGRRINRFLATAILDGKEVHSFFPNPGRLKELLVSGTPVLLTPQSGENRKTSFDMIAIKHPKTWVSIDSRIPNIIMKDALEQGNLELFKNYMKIKPEYNYGKSRIDFLLENDEKCLLEVKSCTLIKDGTALFPDAPTARGKRHLEELARAKKEGYRACAAFVVQRDDARSFTSNKETDAAFSDALTKAHYEGVEIFAFSCKVNNRGVKLKGSLPVLL